MQKETRRNSAAGSAKANPPRKLTRAEKKQIAEIIRQAKGDGKAHTAQQTIPYIQMYPDGICKVTGRKYSKTVAFEDINYQLAQADEKTAIFENWCDFLNYFDASVSVQLSFINQGTQRGEAEKAVNIPAQEDAFNSIRTEYRDMLKNQLAKGNNGLVKAKYITFAIEADSLGAAKSRLARIETDVLNNFKLLGVAARPMTGYERLKMLHGIFHPEGGQFSFDFSWLAPSGLSTKDFIAPSSFRFGEGRYFRMGRKIGAVSFLEILAPELNDRILSDILDLETGVIVNLHIHSIDQTEAIKTIKRKITDLDKMKIEEQKKAVRSGYDMDIIPSDLATFGSEAKNLLQDLQSRNERMFLLTFLVVNMADTKRKLENDVFAAAGIAQKNNCALTRLDYQQEAGLMSSVPLGENLIPIQRGLTTSSTAIFIPFITQELFQSGAALYYGLNALSNNMILCDRKQLKNPNGLILGTPGSGKSFAAKREMANAFLITDDDIIICDPEAEYFSLVQRLDGQVIRLSPTGKGIDGKPQYVNPMDINLNYSEDDSPLALKSDFILSLCELVIGGKEGLQPVDKTVIDRAVRNVYRPFLADPDPEKMPILGDLYDELLKQPEPEAARIAAALELYVSGSLNVFNHRTNVELSNRLVCFDIKQLGNRYIETVFIKRRDGGTVCVSTQVGCSVGCIFCESGRNGFVRNLTPSEIVQQVVLIRQKVNRIVFMGMGEPLFNYDNLIAAIHILRDRNGLNFPTDGITVSTVGPVNQLKKLREEHLKIQLTISLHAATQAARNCIIPHMHMYAIEDVVKQALSYSQRHNRKVVFAYLLLPGINDRSSDIRQLAKWFKGKNVMINVLQYNPTSNSKIRAPQKQEMVAFKHQLEQTGLEVTMRVSHGREIKAACGQLANTYNKAKKQQK